MKTKIIFYPIIWLSLLSAQVDYATEIQPIFNNSCTSCHGNSGGLSLSSYDNLMSNNVVVAGDHADSELYNRITLPETANGDMPPSGSLSQSDIDLIAQWIDEGALEVPAVEVDTPDVVINEFLAGSDNCCGSDIFDGNTEDFVELYNYGTESININGWGFSDTDGLITTTAPDTSIAPGDFLVLWYTGDNNGFPEINEKLSKDGETIYIADADGNPMISYDFGPQTDDVSYGRNPDGSDMWEYFSIPTPGTTNEIIGCADGEVELWNECYSVNNTTDLDLSNTGLTGAIPIEIGDMVNLERLVLSNNELSGEIPSTIGNLMNLESLHLGENSLTGSIPSEIENLMNLTSLTLFSNQLTGEIPPEIGNLTNLIVLWLFDNQLTGEIPNEIWNLTNLEKLYLSDNQLTGEIPSEIGNLTNLERLYLSDNQLTGVIPSEIGNLTNLERILFFNNQLTGEIPLQIENLTNLEDLYLQNNQLTGTIPSGIGNYSNLEVLKLHANQLTGSIPVTLCNLSNLTWSLEDTSWSVSTIYGNQFCPLYPSCIQEYVGDQDTSGCDQVSILDETLPVTFNLYNAYPNPFNPMTTLGYDLPEDGFVNITIYDMMGRKVKTLVNSLQTGGYKSVKWNAMDNQGHLVPAGAYLYKIEFSHFVVTRKMILLK